LLLTEDAACALALPEPPRLGMSTLDAPATADSMMARRLRVQAFIGFPFFIGCAPLRFPGSDMTGKRNLPERELNPHNHDMGRLI
jgi:hypothetical protein